jgi:hypothetical protein
MKNKTIRIDDRTPDQIKTHYCLITATDKFMSGWGLAKNGLSKCAWACEKKHVHKVLAWVQNRSDMKYVNVNYTGKWYPVAAHVHIYVVTDDHPAVNHNL